MGINSTVGPEGICPSLLVFGVMPKLPIPGSSPAAVPHGKRMIAVEQTCEEYIKIVTKLRLKTAEKTFVPKSPPLSLKYNDKVLVYRNTTGRWEHRTFVARDESTITLIEPDGKSQPYGITRVSEYNEGTFLSTPDLYGIIPSESTECTINQTPTSPAHPADSTGAPPPPV